MIIFKPEEREIIEAEIGPILNIKPIYPFWKKWAGWGGMTQPGMVEGRNGHCKIVALRPELRDDPAAIENLSQRISVYQSLSSCRGLPRLILHGDHFMITDWLDGALLSETQLTEDDVDGLANAVSETYSQMELVLNPLGVEELLRQARDLQSRDLLHNGIEDRIERFLSCTPVPHQVLKGACFGDVALKNFVRQPSGEIGYIDTMGVDVVHRPINVAKILDILGDQWSAFFLDRLIEYGPALSDPRADGSYFNLVRCLRTISAKSKGGRGIVAILRRRRSKAAVCRLHLLLQS